jgi:fructokinase
VTSAQVILFGGGVLGPPGLLARIRTAVTACNHGYWAEDDDIGAIIRAPALGTKAGLCGGLFLAQRAQG